MNANNTLPAVSDDSPDSPPASLDVYLHPEGGRAKRVSVEASARIEEFLRAAGHPVDGELHVFVGDVEDDDAERDDADDEPVAADLAASVEEAGIGRHAHVCCHCCRRIEVSVAYNGRNVRKRFSPAARISRIVKWAKRRLGVADEPTLDGAEVQVKGGQDRPAGDIRIGTLATGHACALAFTLVVPERVNGCGIAGGAVDAE